MLIIEILFFKFEKFIPLNIPFFQPLNEKIAFHKFSPCNYVANMWQLRNKYRESTMVNATFAYKKTGVIITRRGENPFFRPVSYSTSNFPEVWTVILGQFLCRFSVVRDFIPSCIQLCACNWTVMLCEYLWVFKVLCSQVSDCKKRLLSSKTFHLINSFF